MESGGYELKERPILFSAPMVRAILEGRKTQTRRIVKPQPSEEWHPEVGIYAPTVVDRHGEEGPGADVYGASDEDEGRISAHGQPGDRLWVREGFRHYCNEWHCGVPVAHLTYLADNGHGIVSFASAEPPVQKWWNKDKAPKPTAIFMPRWASRITLEITEIRVQRLQEITQPDAQAEGVSGREEFSELWDSINKKKCPWNSNPWVWAITFKQA